jgi:threonyl-tRNA synthetase
LQSEKFTVRDRNEKKQRQDVKLEELISEIKSQTNNKPYLPLNLPRNLSNRPQIMV